MLRTISRKSIFSVILAIIVATVLLIPNFEQSTTNAAENPTGIDALSAEEKANVDSTLIDLDVADESIDNFKAMGFEINNISIDGDGNLALATHIADTDSAITITMATDNQIAYTVVEGSKRDSVLIDDTGRVFLDGREVIVTTEEEMVEDPSAPNDVQADSQARYKSCPYGKASSYTYYAKKVTKRIQLAKKICKYTITGLSAAMGIFIGGPAAGVAATVASGILEDAITSDGDVIKSVAKVYYHAKKKKFMVESSIGCQKEATNYYGKSGRHLYSKTLWLYSHVNGA